MPLTATGKKVLAKMKEKYGDEKGEEVFYASINAGKAGTEGWHESERRKPGAPKGARSHKKGMRPEGRPKGSRHAT